MSVSLNVNGVQRTSQAEPDAPLLDRALRGVPVRLQWMREDEFGWEPLGSPVVMEPKASLEKYENLAVCCAISVDVNVDARKGQRFRR